MAKKLSDHQIDTLKGDIREFIQYFEESVTDTRECKDLILDYLDVIFIDSLPNYYNNNFDPVRSEMNALLDIMSMSKFVKAFKSVLEDEEIENFPYYRGYIGESLSVLVECNHSTMSDETVHVYTWTIMRRLWSKEISMMRQDFDITEELALDLLIGIPTHPNNIEQIQLDRFTNNLKNSLMSHTASDANLDVLGFTTIARILDFFFGKDSKVQLNALGKILGAEEDTVEQIGRWQGPIYNQFIKAIYTKLNQFDIRDIKYVIKYIVGQNRRYQEKNKDKALFDLGIAHEFRNIKTALSKLIEEDPTVKKYL